MEKKCVIDHLIFDYIVFSLGFALSTLEAQEVENVRNFKN